MRRDEGQDGRRDGGGYCWAELAQVVILARKKGGEVGGGGVRVVATDCVQYLDAVFDKLVGRDALWVLERSEAECRGAREH